MASKEKILRIKRDVLKNVESLLEKGISEEFLLEKCNKLSQADYDDVVQERSIELMCGYPVCNKPIKQMMKQKYRISRTDNKIYDITERKKFCCNECYKASTFLKGQLPSLPLYMRKNEVASSLKLKLLSDSDNKGSAGEELVFNYTINKKDIEEAVPQPFVSTNLNSMLQEDIKDCREHLNNLEIKENVFKDKYVFGGESSNMLSCNACSESTSESSDSSEDDDDKTLFPEYDNVEVLSNKLMPVPGKSKKAVLIAPLNATKISVQSPAKLPIKFFAKVFQDWFSEDTMKFLLGEKQVFSLKADHLFKKLVDSDEPQDRLSSIKEEYVNLCLKIDKLPEEEDEVDDISEINISERKTFKKCESSHNLENFITEMDSLLVSPKVNLKKRTKRKTQSKKKSVSFKSDSVTDKKVSTENNLSEDKEAKTLFEPAVPLFDSLSQNALRRQVLMSKLKNVFINLLPMIDKHYRDIKEEVAVIVNTFSLTPTNIVHKPKQLNCIATILFRILTLTRLKELHNDTEFSKLCENSLASENISKEEVENLALDLVSPNQVLKLQKIDVK